MTGGGGNGNLLNIEQGKSQNMKVKIRQGSIQERKHRPAEDQTS